MDFFFVFLPILFPFTKVPLSVSLSIPGRSDDDEREGGRGGRGLRNNNLRHKLTYQTRGKPPTHRDTCKQSRGEEEEQAYLRRTRPAYPAEGEKDTSAAVQIPTELSYFFSHPRLPSRPAIQTGCPPRPSAPAPPPPKS